jgi:hypothetical protein
MSAPMTSASAPSQIQAFRPGVIVALTVPQL